MRTFTMTLALCLATAASAASPYGDHVGWAMALADNVPNENNLYSEESSVAYAGIDGEEFRAEVKCASFLTRMMERAYNVDYMDWMSCDSPNARTYYEQIAAENDFEIIGNVHDLQAGDIFARVHPECSNLSCGAVDTSTCSSSGHIAILVAAPVKLRVALAPKKPGLDQYALHVVDSTRSPHFTTDSRHPDNGGGGEGVGYGTMRVYADADGNIVGHAWSLSTGTDYHDDTTRPVLFGRWSPPPPGRNAAWNGGGWITP